MKKREYVVGTELTDGQCELIEPHLSMLDPSGKGGQKPASRRICFEGVLCLLEAGRAGKLCLGIRHGPVQKYGICGVLGQVAEGLLLLQYRHMTHR